MVYLRASPGGWQDGSKEGQGRRRVDGAMGIETKPVLGRAEGGGRGIPPDRSVFMRGWGEDLYPINTASHCVMGLGLPL